MTLVLDDGDIRLYQGDALDQLAQLADGSVDCVVTSPPYWGLRDYGTGAWAGGDPDCDHAQTVARHDGGRANVDGFNGSTRPDSDKGAIQFRDVCGKCGATRTDQQLGLEPTPDQYIENMVTVFRQVRRVLAGHGTCWVTMGDSYSPGKQLAMIPARLALALQADDWILRADIIWAKPNPMPESVTDRPTKAHEYVFLLTKSPRYWFDQEAVREPPQAYDRKGGTAAWTADSGHTNGIGSASFHQMAAAGRNVRSVWEIATQPYPMAHFATYPEELVRRCLLAGCPEQVCRVCGKPRERIVETDGSRWAERVANGEPPRHGVSGVKPSYSVGSNPRQVLGWSDCGCLLTGEEDVKEDPQLDGSSAPSDAQALGGSSSAVSKWRPGVVLDPFAGSGTTLHVARKHGRHAIGIELNPQYCALILERTKQLSLLA